MRLANCYAQLASPREYAARHGGQRHRCIPALLLANCRPDRTRPTLRLHNKVYNQNRGGACSIS